MYYLKYLWFITKAWLAQKFFELELNFQEHLYRYQVFKKELVLAKERQVWINAARQKRLSSIKYKTLTK